MFHNILVAVDGSPDAEQALTQAIDLAESEHTRLTLITGVQQLPPIAYAGLSGGAVGPDRRQRPIMGASSATARTRPRPRRPARHHDPDRPADPRRAHRPDQPRPARPCRDGLTRPRRDPRRPPRHRQPLHPQSQPRAGPDRPHRHPPDREAAPTPAPRPSDTRSQRPPPHSDPEERRTRCAAASSRSDRARPGSVV